MGRGQSWNKRTQQKRPLGQSSREINNTFVIYCEGENTEPNYFKAFKMRAETAVIPIGTGRSKTALVEFAIKDLAKREKERNRQAWVVFDYDIDLKKSNQNADLKEAMRLADKKDLKIAFSNDCFELWFLLHFQFIDVAMHRNQLYELLGKKFNIDYEKEGKSKAESLKIYQQLLDKQPVAIKNAEKLYELQSKQNRTEENPITTVHELVEQMNRFLR
jgi:RloB-like protein